MASYGYVRDCIPAVNASVRFGSQAGALATILANNAAKFSRLSTTSHAGFLDSATFAPPGPVSFPYTTASPIRYASLAVNKPAAFARVSTTNGTGFLASGILSGAQTIYTSTGTTVIGADGSTLSITTPGTTTVIAPPIVIIDIDGDGFSEAEEILMGTSDSVFNDPQADGNPQSWPQNVQERTLVVVGDSAVNVQKSDTKPVTIPAGSGTWLLVRAIKSREFPYYTRQASIFNDTISGSASGVTGGSFPSTNVNSLHQSWLAASNPVKSFLGYSPVDVQILGSINAGASADKTVTLSLTVTNISDHLLPTTGILSLIPVDLGVDNNRDGTLALGSGADQTTEQKPYRFWLNNDHDDYGDDTYDDQHDHPWTAQSLDSANSLIESKRDLDDLARLHLRVEGMQQALAAGTMTLELKWARTLSGTPKIRVFKAVENDGGTKYLSDTAKAADQMSGGRSELGVVQGTTGFDLPASFWTGANSSSAKYFLFEGVGEGKAELTLVFKQGATVLGQGGSVFLELLDIRKMYERGKIADAASFPDPDTYSPTTVSGITALADPNGFPFQSAWDEDTADKSYIVCVHGWRKTYFGARSDELTMFKRLWHRGFKGRYSGFYWPTLTGGPVAAKFNHSEYRAWKCGEAFKAYVESTLPTEYRKCIIAHSLGNVMVGSALNRGLRFHKYALLNGAIAAQCFDPNPVLKQTAMLQSLPTGLWWPFDVSNYNAWAGGDLGDDTLAGIRALAYRSRVGPASVGTTKLINFYLAADEALSAWEANQWAAGDGVPGIDSKPVDGYDYYVNHWLAFDGPLGLVSRALTDPHESMSMVNQSMTKPVGGESRTSGSVDLSMSVDMNGPGMVFGKEHQAEFMWVPSKTWKFYQMFMEKPDYNPTP